MTIVSAPSARRSWETWTCSAFVAVARRLLAPQHVDQPRHRDDACRGARAAQPAARAAWRASSIAPSGRRPAAARGSRSPSRRRFTGALPTAQPDPGQDREPHPGGGLLPTSVASGTRPYRSWSFAPCRSPDAVRRAWSPWRGNSGGPLPERVAVLRPRRGSGGSCAPSAGPWGRAPARTAHPQLLEQPRHLGELAVRRVRPAGRREHAAGRGARARGSPRIRSRSTAGVLASAAAAASRRRAGSARRRPAGARRSG